MASLKSLSEEDVKLRFITPAITAKGWSVEDITMEKKVKFTDGKINLRGNLVARSKAKYADYMLFYNRAKPIAIVEAKDANHSVSFGLQQAKDYASMQDVPFAFSSNGLGFQEYDFLTGRERTLPMDAFPTKKELYARYLSESNGGESLSARHEISSEVNLAISKLHLCLHGDICQRPSFAGDCWRDVSQLNVLFT